MTPVPEIKSLVFKGYPPIHCCCDSTWRRLPNGEQAVFFMTGGGFEPEPSNHVVLCRSADGVTWGEQEIIHRTPECERDLFTKIPRHIDKDWRERCLPGIAATMSEVVVHEGVITVYIQIHDGWFGHLTTCTVTSADNGHTWSEPREFTPLPRRSLIRNLYRATWGEYFLPFQYYPPTGPWETGLFDDGSFRNPQTGVLIGPTPNGPWERGEMISGPSGWAEVNVVELESGVLVMLSRSNEGMLMRTESGDRGRTWSGYVKTDIPNPSSKFRLFRLSDGRIVLLHNPSPLTEHPNDKLKYLCMVRRNPLSLWISSNNMETWDYQRDISDFPGMLSYPDGEPDAEEKYLHFAFDYNRHDVIYWKVEIPASPGK